MTDIAILIMIGLIALALPTGDTGDTTQDNRIDNMTRYEIDKKLKEDGLYYEYKDYSLENKKTKLKERYNYFK